MTRAAALAGLAALALAACAGGEPGAPKAAPSAPQAAEGQRFELPDGSAAATVPARLAGAPVQGEQPGLWRLQFEVAPGKSAVCNFSQEPEVRVAPAHLLAQVAVASIQAGGRPAGLESRVRAGAVDAAPFLTLDMAVEYPDGVRVLAQRLAVKEGRLVVCSSGGEGAEARVDRLFYPLVETLESRPAPEPPSFGMVQTVLVNGEPVGFVRLAMSTQGDEILTERNTSLLFGTPDGGVVPVDELLVEHVRPDGLLLGAEMRRVRGFQDEMDLMLSPAGPGAWRVTGRLNGEPVEESFPTAGPLVSHLAQLRTIQDAARGERTGVPIALREWVPDLEIGGTSEVTVSLERDLAGGITVQERAGDMIYTYPLDARLLPDSGTIQSGTDHLEQRREVVFGELPEATDAR